MIHTLLGKENLTERKADLCMSFSDGRTASSRELTVQEAKDFIEYLLNDEKRKEIIKAIWYLAYAAGMITDGDELDRRINAIKIDLFCMERGAVKKPLNKQNLNELQRTRRQFEAINAQRERKQKAIDIRTDYEKMMQRCVDREDYEVAAYLRDELRKKINEIESKRNKRA